MHAVTYQLPAKYGISPCPNTRPTSVELTFTFLSNNNVTCTAQTCTRPHIHRHMSASYSELAATAVWQQYQTHCRWLVFQQLNDLLLIYCYKSERCSTSMTTHHCHSLLGSELISINLVLTKFISDHDGAFCLSEFDNDLVRSLTECTSKH